VTTIRKLVIGWFLLGLGIGLAFSFTFRLSGEPTRQGVKSSRVCVWQTTADDIGYRDLLTGKSYDSIPKCGG